MIDLEAIKARAEAATPGPWGTAEFGDERLVFEEEPDQSTAIAILVDSSVRDKSEANGAFIAHARTDVPALVAEAEELRRIVRLLAAGPWIYDSYVCFQCKSLVNADETMDEPHSLFCPYALAVRWVGNNPE